MNNLECSSRARFGFCFWPGTEASLVKLRDQVQLTHPAHTRIVPGFLSLRRLRLEPRLVVVEKGRVPLVFPHLALACTVASSFQLV